MGAVTRIEIPYAPRKLQRAIHDGFAKKRYGVAVCHRRFGKTVWAVNHLQKASVECKKPRPRFAYLAPTYAQGKAIAWDYMKHYSDPIPGVKKHESELRVDYAANDSQVRIYGADNPDSLRGLYFDGIVLDEYGLMRPSVFDEVIRPTLSDRKGWAFFMGTPNGKNQFYKAVQDAKNSDDWFYAEYKASETGIIPPDELLDAFRVMGPERYAQEYECSFEAAVRGAVYARELQQAREDGRITHVPYDPAVPVDTDWDIGVGDSSAIWFTQSLPGGRINVIDYYEAFGFGLPHYKQVLNEKGYAYGQHWGPHDIEQREFATGLSRIETAATLGIVFSVVPRLNHVEDGIHAARMIFPKCWFDSKKCEKGLESLQHYRWAQEVKTEEIKFKPVHDWASHGADAFRGLGTRYVEPKLQKEAIREAKQDTAEVAHRLMLRQHYSYRPQRAASGRGRGGY